MNIRVGAKKGERGVMIKQSMLDAICNQGWAQQFGVYGIHIYHKGESKQRLFRDLERVPLYSGSKTYTAMAVGIAEAEGLLSLQDKAIDFFPDVQPSAQAESGNITVLDLLQMRAGHGASLFTTDEWLWEQKQDWAEMFFQLPMATEPGSTFVYDNGCSYMLSRIVETVSGETLRDYLIPRLFTPMGIHHPQWHTCPHGHTLGAVGLYLTTEEFSRLGILMLQHGRWDQTQLVPAEYVGASINHTVTAEGFEDPENSQGYGYQLWRCTVPGAFRADGKYGQYCVVLPDIQSVITITAHNQICANDILRSIWKDLLPFVSV